MFVFVSRSGNRYIYSSELNVVFPLLNDEDEALVKILDSDGLSVTTLTRIKDTFPSSMILTPILTLGELYVHAKSFGNDSKVNADNVKQLLAKSGYCQTTLEVTQNCNLRCRYCFFSDQYKLT